jgi:hypothetical protein
VRKLDPCDVQNARVAQFADETELTHPTRPHTGRRPTRREQRERHTPVAPIETSASQDYFSARIGCQVRSPHAMDITALGLCQ